ncbi:hypothetical protein EDB85DRAFT_276678 [Lactarius pseudohatsudake]|nr:hypothetical protein EDB85DRAFT_276678 [Lactarius pseudohatsudake]
MMRTSCKSRAIYSSPDGICLKQSYEEMFMKINPLQSAAASKNKSKDIHLPSIDVSFGSNRILSGASLTLAYGRRYGIIGRNGVGKSTLLRHIAMREVPIPPHITILFVEQEIVRYHGTQLGSQGRRIARSPPFGGSASQRATCGAKRHSPCELESGSTRRRTRRADGLRRCMHAWQRVALLEQRLCWLLQSLARMKGISKVLLWWLAVHTFLCCDARLTPDSRMRLALAQALFVKSIWMR